jgi:hypothetical protein
MSGTRGLTSSTLRVRATMLVTALALGCGSGGDGSGPQAQNRTATPRGYVVSSFSFMFPEHDADPCPGGFTKGPIEMQVEDGVVLPDDCLDPERVSDPGFKTLDGPGRFAGFDLDGRTSSRSAPASGECAHDDFIGTSGERGFDYQFWRAVGCVRGFQRDEIGHIVIREAVVSGSMTILLELTEVDDERNDARAGAQLFGSTDVPAIGADGRVLPFATLSIHENAVYHGSVGTGEIADGVFLAGPMDIKLRLNIQIVEGDQTLRDAYARIEFLPDGSVKGQLFGYQPISEVYDIFGVQAGPAGAAALSYTCTGLWQALKDNADGHRDPSSGACSTISVAYQFEAVPAFVVK